MSVFMTALLFDICISVLTHWTTDMGAVNHIRRVLHSSVSQPISLTYSADFFFFLLVIFIVLTLFEIRPQAAASDKQ